MENCKRKKHIGLSLLVKFWLQFDGLSLAIPGSHKMFRSRSVFLADSALHFFRTETNKGLLLPHIPSIVSCQGKAHSPCAF